LGLSIQEAFFFQIKELGPLRQFAALGRLWLGDNFLTWPEIIKLRHLSIIELTLTGNAGLGDFCPFTPPPVVFAS